MARILGHYEIGKPIVPLQLGNLDAKRDWSDAEDFVKGFLMEEGTSRFARLAGLVELPDGSLLVSDDTNGVIYRVSYN